LAQCLYNPSRRNFYRAASDTDARQIARVVLMDDLAEEPASNRHRHPNHRPGAKQADKGEDEKVCRVGPNRFVAVKFGAEFPKARYAVIGVGFGASGIDGLLG